MKTNHIHIVLVILFLMATKTQSQTLLDRLELTAGVNLMNVNFNTSFILDDTNDAKLFTKTINLNDRFYTNETGFYIGLIYTNLFIVKKLEIQPEIRFVGVKNFNQLQIPMLLKYEVFEKLKLQLGPNLGFLLDTPKDLKSFHFALDFGISYNVATNLLIEARYNWGQTNLLKKGNGDYYLKLNSFQIGLVYKLKSKKNKK